MEVTLAYIFNMFAHANRCMEHGIYIPSTTHPCCWDFIDFSYMNDPEEPIDLEWISGGCYKSHPCADKTLQEILEADNRWEYLIQDIEWQH